MWKPICILIITLSIGSVAVAANNMERCSPEQFVPSGQGRKTIYVGSTEGAYRICRQPSNGRPGVSTQIFIDGSLAGELPFLAGQTNPICLDVVAKKIEVQESDGGYTTGERYRRLCP